MDDPQHEACSARHVSYPLDGRPGSTAAARDHARAFFGGRPTPVPEPRLGEAVLVVSELVANAVRHAPGPCTLDLGQLGGRLSIAVSDTGAAPPVPRTPDLIGGGGFGLHLLGVLGQQVRTTYRRRGGKTITAFLPGLLHTVLL